MDYRQRKIKTYVWHAIDHFGVAISGIYSAYHPLEVKQYLQSRELLIRRVRLKHNLFNSRIKTQELDRLIREISTLLSAGLPIITILNLLEVNWKKSNLCNTIVDLKQSVQGGQSFARALCESGLFEPIDARLIEAGESSGKLIDVFQSIMQYRAKRLNLKRNIQKALTYPLTVGALSVLITWGFIFQIIPSFTLLFQQSGVELPSATKHLLQATTWIKNYSMPIFAMILLAGSAIIYMYRTQYSFKQRLHNWRCNLPAVGNLVRSIAIARFVQAFALTSASGLTLVDALACISGVTGNPKYDSGIRIMCAQIEQGQRLSEVMLVSELFPQVVIQRIQLAESAGCLQQMLQSLAADLSDQIDERLELITRMLEPCIMIGLGVWIFALVIALYLPLFESGGLM